jgi:serine/threonine protein kinase
MPKPTDPSCDLLIGLLALQTGLIDQGGLFAAFAAWTRDKGRSLADHLVELGHLDSPRRAAVEAIAHVHVQALGGEIEKSLAVLAVGRSTRESLVRAGGSEVEATLGHVRRAPGSTHDDDEDPDRTASYSVGSATSDGQRFRILRPHAQGGLGAVFVALDIELHREVALKQILGKHADDPTSRARFVLEAEVTGGLEHPGIVPVYGLGKSDGGRPYYAMRFIRGDTLKEAIEHYHADAALRSDAGRRSLELRKLLGRFVDVCDAISYAHSRGILHRDIKPSNIIVGKFGETLVVDWGLAKPMGRVEPGADSGERTRRPSSASGSSETLPGSALGTPAYMSPEQAEGDLEHLGLRSDVYTWSSKIPVLPNSAILRRSLAAMQSARSWPWAASARQGSYRIAPSRDSRNWYGPSPAMSSNAGTWPRACCVVARCAGPRATSPAPRLIGMGRPRFTETRSILAPPSEFTLPAATLGCRALPGCRARRFQPRTGRSKPAARWIFSVRRSPRASVDATGSVPSRSSTRCAVGPTSSS